MPGQLAVDSTGTHGQRSNSVYQAWELPPEVAAALAVNCNVAWKLAQLNSPAIEFDFVQPAHRRQVGRRVALVVQAR